MVGFARLVCGVRGHDLSGPEVAGRLLCARCGDVFDARMVREFDAELRRRGERGLLPDVGGEAARWLS